MFFPEPFLRSRKIEAVVKDTSVQESCPKVITATLNCLLLNAILKHTRPRMTDDRSCVVESQ